MYISEEQRFNKNPTEFQEVDKSRRKRSHQLKIENLKNIFNIVENQSLAKDTYNDVKEFFSINQRTKNMYVYENVMFFINILEK